MTGRAGRAAAAGWSSTATTPTSTASRPTAPGSQIRIGDRQHPEPGTVRGLAVELALLPVEGGARVAIVRDAQRMNDDAQSALLKTLEEPPAGTTLILCADDEERLLPTVRSRCARIRLGPVGAGTIEAAARRAASSPTPRRRPGSPGSPAAGPASPSRTRAPEAERLRGELVRTLARPARRRPRRAAAARRARADRPRRRASARC